MAYAIKRVCQSIKRKLMSHRFNPCMPQKISEIPSAENNGPKHINKRDGKSKNIRNNTTKNSQPQIYRSLCVSF